MNDSAVSPLEDRLILHTPKLRRASAFASILVAVVLSIAPTHSEAGGPPQTLDVTGVGGEFMSCPPDGGGLGPEFEVPGGGYGFLSRIGHIAGETVGRDDSITHVGLAPYVFHEETMLFGDLRLIRTNEGHTGGSAGMGLRHYLTEQDAILGIAGYYDSDDSRGARFKQLGLSLEYLSRMFDVRANWYVPIEDTERVLGLNVVNGSERFQANELLFDLARETGSAADGGDLMISTPIPGEIPELFNLEVSGGAYHYRVVGSDQTEMWGYKLRTDADMFKRVLHMFLELTSDRVTNTNLVFGASLNYYQGFENKRRLHDRQFYRMSEWVRRNFTVVTINDTQTIEGVVAQNPDTGNDYFFSHVRNIPVPPAGFQNFPGVTGDGTFEMPFDTIQAAQADVAGLGTDGIVYVHGDSEFVGDFARIEMTDDSTILGEGQNDGVINPLLVRVEGMDRTVKLPNVILGASRPELISATNTAVTAADRSQFGGFVITAPGGNGIDFLSTDGDEDGRVSYVHNVDINMATGDGIFLENAIGRYHFHNMQIENAAGVGFHVSGGNSEIRVNQIEELFVGNKTVTDALAIEAPTTITNAQEEALLITDTTGGFVAFGNGIINDNGGAGIRLINNAGSVTLGTATINDTVLSSDPTSVGAGLEITGSTGETTLARDITITNAAGVGFLVKDLADGGVVRPSALLEINQRNNIGADFVNIDGNASADTGVLFSSTSDLQIGALNGATADHPAIRFSSDSSGVVRLNNFVIADSLAQGILVGDPTGVNINVDGAAFEMIGDATGTIGTSSDAAIEVAGGGALTREPADLLIRGTISSDFRLQRGIDIQFTEGVINFGGLTTINNSLGSPFASLFIEDVTGSVSFQTFTADGNLAGTPDINESGDEPAVDIQVVRDPVGVRFATLNIANADGIDGLDVDDVNLLFTRGGTIDVDNESAVEIMNTEMDVGLTSVSSSDSPDNGIFIQDSPGQFSIVGDMFSATNDGSGGQISNAAREGTLIFNTVPIGEQEIFLRQQDYTNNLIGIRVFDLNDDEGDSLTVDLARISDSVEQGIFTTDVRNVVITSSIFMDNGQGDAVGTQQHIRLDVAENPNSADLSFLHPDYQFYNYVINNNIFDDQELVFADDGVLIQTVGDVGAGGDFDFGPGLQLTFRANDFQQFDRTFDMDVSVSQPTAFHVRWDGRLDADPGNQALLNQGIVGNIVTVLNDGDRQTAFSIENTGANSSAAIIFNQNIVTFADALSTSITGAKFLMSGPAAIDVNQNIISFNSDDSDNTAVEFRFLSSGNDVQIDSNEIRMNGGGTGINVTRVVAPSIFTIDNNIISGPVAGIGFPDRGIVFGTVLGGPVTLRSNVFNLIEVNVPINANLLSIPQGPENGQILIDPGPLGSPGALPQ